MEEHNAASTSSLSQTPVTSETIAATPSLHAENTASKAAPKSTDTTTTAEPAGMAATDGASTPAEMLKRTSSAHPSSIANVHLDPREQYPSLNLSGKIISAAFCIPYEVDFAANETWHLRPRWGTSTLFDSFNYLASSKTPWKHTLVAWTGEIQPLSGSSTPAKVSDSLDRPGPGMVRSKHSASSRITASARSLSKASTPIPLYPPGKHQASPVNTDGIKIAKKDRNRLEAILADDKSGTILPIWLSSDTDDDESDLHLKDQTRWRHYAEHELYALFHYRQHGPDDGGAERKWWADYVRMNQLFADRILEIYEAGDVVWIHDYHLMLLPLMLRQRIPNIYIAFFLHIPFPSSEYFKCLPRRKDLLEGCLGATMIAFQTFDYTRHFSSCCERILGFESSPTGIDAYGAHVAIDICPTGINVEAVNREAFEDPRIETTVSNLKQLYRDKKIIVGRDRLDTVQGVALKLMAFERLLEQYPQWRHKVVLIQLTSPTSVEMEQEERQRKIEDQISELVSKINGEYGSLSHSPVQHHPQHLTNHDYYALLRIADIGLITSVRDGTNTTSLEYVVCQKENHGPLILSEFSGTAVPLKDAIVINPWDLQGVAHAISRALEMPTQTRDQAHAKLYHEVISNPLSVWCDHFLSRLLTNLLSNNQNLLTPALDRHILKPQYLHAKKRLFLFDYDGTLTPIVKDPAAAIPSDRVLRTVKSLAQNPKNAVWIISGRDQKFLDDWMGHIPELGLSAEHGCFIRPPRSEIWENLTEKIDMGWQDRVAETYQTFVDKTPGSFIERKRVALTWHYRRSDPDLGKWQAEQCKHMLQSGVLKGYEVEVISGKANLEVRPQFVNKGYITSRIIDEYGNEEGHPPDFVFCAGDDFTDEDMFRALLRCHLPRRDLFAVTVGASSKKTLASWHLLEPRDVIAALGSLIAAEDADDGVGQKNPARVKSLA